MSMYDQGVLVSVYLEISDGQSKLEVLGCWAKPWLLVVRVVKQRLSIKGIHAKENKLNGKPCDNIKMA